jgi:adenylate cyclase
MERRLAAILAADVVGYSRLMGKDEAKTLASFKAHQKEAIDPRIAQHHGRIVKLMGDGFLAEFSSVVEAVECAVAIQTEMAERNADVPQDTRIEFRMGVNLGDVIVEGDDLFGDGVNIAARLEGLAKPGRVCLSRAARDQVVDKVAIEFEDLGEFAFKNIARPIQVYQAAKIHSINLKGTSTLSSPHHTKPTIAVLPFLNLSRDPEQEYFSDGITEDIITALSRLHWFFVIARNSSFVYKGKAVDVKQVGRELGVRYILEGSVRKSGNRVRVAAQLVDSTSGAHYWAQNYDRELTDIFELQDDITQSVTAAIEPKLVAAEAIRSEGRSPADLEAWDLVMRALAHFWKMTTAESESAIAMLREAVRRYPDYGPAHSMLAFALLVSGHVGWILESQDEAYAAELAHRAAEIDDDDPWAHLALGYVAFAARHTDEAVRQCLRALDLNPNFATGYGYLGWALVFDGQFDEAIRYFEQALRMSPHDPLKAFFFSGTGVGHYYARRYDEAIDWARKAVRERPGFTAAHRILCASLGQTERTEETSAAMAKLRKLQPNISIAWIEQYVPYTSRAMPHFLDGMRKAGLE